MILVAKIENRLVRELRKTLFKIRIRRSANALISSGLFDGGYVSIVFGKDFSSTKRAAHHYLQNGAPKLIPFHPLIDPWYSGANAQKKLKDGDIRGFLALLRSTEQRNKSQFWCAFLNAGALPEEQIAKPVSQVINWIYQRGSIPQNPAAPRSRMDLKGAVEYQKAAAKSQLDFLGTALQKSDDDFGSSSNSGRYSVSWAEIDETKNVKGLVSIIVLVPEKFHDLRKAARALRSTCLGCENREIEVVIVDASLDHETMRILGQEARALSDQLQHLFVEEQLSIPELANFGIAHANGEFLVFTDLMIRGELGWLNPLLEDLADDNIAASQSLVSSASATIANSGYVFIDHGPFPYLFLNGLPLDDARRHGGRNMHALGLNAMLHRTKDAIAIKGLDTNLKGWLGGVDYSKRLAAGRELRVNPKSIFIRTNEEEIPADIDTQTSDFVNFKKKWSGSPDHNGRSHHAELGLTVSHAFPELETPRLHVLREGREVEVAGWGRIPSLRWAIKNPAPTGSSGLFWGDTYFAEDLAQALRRLGQEVVVDRRQAFHRDSAHLDDVVLLLHGMEGIAPQLGKVFVNWVISQSQSVTIQDLHAADLVYGASKKWVQQKRSETGLNIRTLLQATSKERFQPGWGSADQTGVFVGSAYKTGPRKIVHDALDVQAKFKIWGKNWANYLNPSLIAAEWLDPNDLSRVYGTARYVLNDHRHPMGELGFINNRMFDAAASGARIVSDYVEGADKIFGKQVKMYRNLDELRQILSPEGLASFPSGTELTMMAENILQNHSFDARAATLLRDVLEIWKTR